MLFFGSSHIVADGHNRLSTQNWWCASRRLATCQQLVDPHLLGIHSILKHGVLAITAKILVFSMQASAARQALTTLVGQVLAPTSVTLGAPSAALIDSRLASVCASIALSN
jgi:hypothetical protein